MKAKRTKYLVQEYMSTVDRWNTLRVYRSREVAERMAKAFDGHFNSGTRVVEKQA